MAVSAALVLALFAPSFEDPLVAIPVWGWAGLAAALAAEPIRQAAGVVAPP
jgi:hypothetical protein